MVLNHVARHDSAWQEDRTVIGRRSGGNIDVSVHGALWLADLKYRAWVPVLGEDGKLEKLAANASTLNAILDPAWLEKNDAAITLLSESFGFDELELRLLGVAPDPQKRLELRNGLAKLVESVGADSELYAALANEVETRRLRGREINRYRRIGLAVQDAVKTAVECCGEAYHLKLKLVDRGFDYEVEIQEGNIIEDMVFRFEVGSYLLEVKATTTGSARLTPLQADTASNNTPRYVLCVVDLRGISEEDLDAEWSAARINPLANIVPNIGENVKETCQLIREARTKSVSIRNDSALRYEVPPEVWVTGLSISAWVASIVASFSNSTGASIIPPDTVSIVSGL